MVGYTRNMPGTRASKARLRRLIIAMVRQLEVETRPPGGEAAGGKGRAALGDIPSLFGTLTTQRYQWDEVIRIIAKAEGIGDHRGLSPAKRRELVSRYPLFVALTAPSGSSWR